MCSLMCYQLTHHHQLISSEAENRAERLCRCFWVFFLVTCFTFSFLVSCASVLLCDYCCYRFLTYELRIFPIVSFCFWSASENVILCDFIKRNTTLYVSVLVDSLALYSHSMTFFYTRLCLTIHFIYSNQRFFSPYFAFFSIFRRCSVSWQLYTALNSDFAEDTAILTEFVKARVSALGCPAGEGEVLGYNRSLEISPEMFLKKYCLDRPWAWQGLWGVGRAYCLPAVMVSPTQRTIDSDLTRGMIGSQAKMLGNTSTQAEGLKMASSKLKHSSSCSLGYQTFCLAFWCNETTDLQAV